RVRRLHLYSWLLFGPSEACAVMEPAGACLVSSFPPVPVQVVCSVVQPVDRECEAPVEFGHGQRDRPGASGGDSSARVDSSGAPAQVLACAAVTEQKARSTHGEHDVPGQGG